MRVKPIFYLPIVLQQLLSCSNYHLTIVTILHVSLFVDFKKKPIVAYRLPIASTAYLPFVTLVDLFVVIMYCL
jgi:hypothetical protein